MKHICILSVLLLLSSMAWGQLAFPAMNGRSVGLAGCGTALTDNGMQNAAAWGWPKQASVGLSVRNTALLKELSYAEIFACIPTRTHGSFALSLDHFGTTAYHEQRAAVAYALPMKRLSLGLRLDYLHSGTADPHYTPLHQFSFAAGMQARPTSRLTLGAHTEGGRLWCVGASYQLVEELTGTAEIEYQNRHALRLRAGVEYCWHRTLYARAGVATNPGLYAFGLGYRTRHFVIDLAMQQQPLLGYSLQSSLIYLF